MNFFEMWLTFLVNSVCVLILLSICLRLWKKSAPPAIIIIAKYLAIFTVLLFMTWSVIDVAIGRKGWVLESVDYDGDPLYSLKKLKSMLQNDAKQTKEHTNLSKNSDKENTPEKQKSQKPKSEKASTNKKEQNKSSKQNKQNKSKQDSAESKAAKEAEEQLRLFNEQIMKKQQQNNR